jgi:hypothetical protein
LATLRENFDELSEAADVNPGLRVQAQAKKMELEKLTTTLMRKALETETNKLAKSASSHTDAWKVLTKLRESPTQCPVPTEKLLAHFSSISKPQDSALLPNPLPQSAVLDMEPLDPEELQEALNGVNQAAAAGPDGISPRLLVSTFVKEGLFEFLFNIVAMCLVLAYVPLQWREATMFVLYKGSGDPCDPNNYRAIALMSAFAKVYERILLRRLLLWFRDSRLWLLPQFGFRAGCGCTHAIFLLRTLILDILEQKRVPVFIAFVDLRKAFPSLGRDALFSRMLRLGIPYPLVQAIRAFYISNVARLRIDNTITRDFFVAVGVLEGSVLSPCLFGILFSVVWDIVGTTPFPTLDLKIFNADSVWLIAYADDLVVVTLDAVKLGEVLNKLAVELRSLNLHMRCVFLSYLFLSILSNNAVISIPFPFVVNSVILAVATILVNVVL